MQDPFVGTWTLNLEKSDLDPNYGGQRFAPGGKASVPHAPAACRGGQAAGQRRSAGRLNGARGASTCGEWETAGRSPPRPVEDEGSVQDRAVFGRLSREAGAGHGGLQGPEEPPHAPCRLPPS
jgi:hypothetical protein